MEGFGNLKMCEEEKEWTAELALNRDLERKSLDRSAARDELSRKEEEEHSKQDGH